MNRRESLARWVLKYCTWYLVLRGYSADQVALWSLESGHNAEQERERANGED